MKKEIDRILIISLIFPVNESNWTNPIVIQSNNNTEDIRVYDDYRSLNATCFHDPFTTPFNDEILDQMEGNEAY